MGFQQPREVQEGSGQSAIKGRIVIDRIAIVHGFFSTTELELSQNGSRKEKQNNQRRITSLKILHDVVQNANGSRNVLST